MMHWANPIRLFDSLFNLISGLGTAKDPRSGNQYSFGIIPRNELEDAYRSNWLARAIVDAPAEDGTREWRAWQANQDQIQAIEDLERNFDLPRKMKMAIIRARLYGGAGLIIGVDDGREPDEPLDITKVGKDDLKFIIVLNRWELNSGPRIYNVASPWYTRPEYYSVATPLYGWGAEGFQGSDPLEYTKQDEGDAARQMFSSNMQGMIKIHPSRIVEFTGNELPDWRLQGVGAGWGDSVIQTVDEAIKDWGMTIGGIASMVNDAKVDVISIPGLSERLSKEEYKNKLLARFSIANLSKSINNSLLLDKDEVWQRIQTSFASLPDLIKEMQVVAAGAAGIPVSRLMGQAPGRGLGTQTTGGEMDVKNYYDRQSSLQETEYRPRLRPLDEVIIRSALGARDPSIHYIWNPLYQQTADEKAKTALVKAQTFQIDVSLGVINEDALREARINQLIEDQTYPGFEDAIDENNDGKPEEPDAVPWKPLMDPRTGQPSNPAHPAIGQKPPPKALPAPPKPVTTQTGDGRPALDQRPGNRYPVFSRDSDDPFIRALVRRVGPHVAHELWLDMQDYSPDQLRDPQGRFAAGASGQPLGTGHGLGERVHYGDLVQRVLAAAKPGTGDFPPDYFYNQAGWDRHDFARNQHVQEATIHAASIARKGDNRPGMGPYPEFVTGSEASDREFAKALAELASHKEHLLKGYTSGLEERAIHQIAGDSLADYDPDQPRDEHGRWTKGGGGASQSGRSAASRATRSSMPAKHPLAGHLEQIKRFLSDTKGGTAIGGITHTVLHASSEVAHEIAVVHPAKEIVTAGIEGALVSLVGASVGGVAGVLAAGVASYAVHHVAHKLGVTPELTHKVLAACTHYLVDHYHQIMHGEGALHLIGRAARLAFKGQTDAVAAPAANDDDILVALKHFARALDDMEFDDDGNEITHANGIADYYGPMFDPVFIDPSQRRDPDSVIDYDPDEPRDETGKWTTGGGSGDEPKTASDLTKTHRSVSVADLIASVPGAAQAIEKAQAKLAASAPTDAPVTRGGFKQADGNYTPEREELHDKIIREHFLTPENVSAARPPAGEPPTTYLLGGRGGSGKSWLTRPGGPVDASHAIMINADEVQEHLPGYEGWNAAHYHEEAAHIGDRIEDLAREAGLNTIHDATMRTPGSTAKRVGLYRDRGYKVHGYYMHASPETAAKRALGRFMGGGERGRYVPPAYSLGSVTNEQSFDNVRHRFDKWAIYDNEGVGKGGAPKLVAKGP